MFQFKQISSLYTAFFAISSVICTVSLAPSAQAAVVPTTKFSQKAPARTISAPLASFTEADEAILDWAAPSTTLKFSLPDGLYAQSMNLTLTALPQGGVNRAEPLTVSFNNGTPVPVRSNGRQFSANITLSKSAIRSVGNTLTLSYPGANKDDCMDDSTGRWIVDLKRSKLSIKASDKPSALRVSQIEPRLSHPMTAPKTVSILAKGIDSQTLSALAAQGIGLRVKDIPAFKMGNQPADLQILVGSRTALGSLIKDPEIANNPRAVVGVQRKNGRLQLVLTGDTAQQALEIARAFSRYHLPSSRRNAVSLAELTMQSAFIYEVQASLTGRKRINDIAPIYFGNNYRPKPAKINFAINNASQSSGELLLGLEKSGNISPDSRIDVALNGKSLGFAKLDKARKRVAFSLPAGSLAAGNNALTLTPILLADAQVCASTTGPKSMPRLSLTPISSLKIDVPKTGQLSLDGFAATGAPFSDKRGANTDVYISSKPRDAEAALGLLAKAAQTSGQGWSEARFVKGMPNGFNTGRHTLILGHVPSFSAASLTSAPRALRDGLRGQGSFDIVTRTASADSDKAFRLAANASRKSHGPNGIASIFTSPSDSQRAIGIISSTQSYGFAKMAKSLTTEKHWQNLSGSVSRWDTRHMAMVQAASSPRIAPTSDRPDSLVNTDALMAAIGEFNLSAQDRFYGLKTAATAYFEGKDEPLFARMKTPKLSAPTYQTVSAPAAIAAPSLAPRRLALSSAPALRMQRHSIPMQNAQKSQFSFAYLKQNLSQKFEATRLKLNSLSVKSMGTKPRAMNIPSVKMPEFKMPALGDATLNSQSWNAAPLKSKGLLIGLVTLMAFMLLGLARPASTGREN
ncbi:MAG: hypothetical protein V3U82_08550 [Robiginitomaculum sp.]